MNTTRPDVLLVSSVFGNQQLSEPMGACILAGCLRAEGFRVELVEPSLHRWTAQAAFEYVRERGARIIGISMLRDEHVLDVLPLVASLRRALPDVFLIVGGHGPSIALQGIHLWKPTATARPLSEVPPALRLGDLTSKHAEGLLSPVLNLPAGAPVVAGAIPYFDKTPEYLKIAQCVDAFMLGESDKTFPRLVRQVLNGEPWRDLPGLFYVDAEYKIHTNPLPPKIEDLDEVPFMARDVLLQASKMYGGNPPASILSSRGCYYRCTFCSVVKYEALQAGKNHRTRSNENITQEMQALHDSYGICTFNFEDDNFIIRNKRGIEKLHELCDRIIALPFKARFSIFCRPDAVIPALFAHFKEAGLSIIYLGIESVYGPDLEFFHKGNSVEEIHGAFDTLAALGFTPEVENESHRIMMGFIPWHPLSSFESLREASRFLRQRRAPPKLLTRKLLLYSQTDVVADVKRLGLLDAGCERGWRFKNERLEGMDQVVSDHFRAVIGVRDRIRTLEKAARSYGYEVPELGELRSWRVGMDEGLHDFFADFVEVCAETGGMTDRAKQFAEDRASAFRRRLEEEGILPVIARGYERCGFSQDVADLWRK
jgi:hypothetical protein